MTSDERTRLRALLGRAVGGRWSTVDYDRSLIVTDDPCGSVTEYVANVVWPGDEDGDPYEANAALIVGAVNALPGLLNALDATERERDVAIAQLAPLLALHDAVRAAAALPGAGHTPEEVVAALRGQGAEAMRKACAEAIASRASQAALRAEHTSPHDDSDDAVRATAAEHALDGALNAIRALPLPGAEVSR